MATMRYAEQQEAPEQPGSHVQFVKGEQGRKWRESGFDHSGSGRPLGSVRQDHSPLNPPRQNQGYAARLQDAQNFTGRTQQVRTSLGEMKTIQCTKGNVALVDDSDFEAVTKHSWSGNRYPQASIKRKKVMMHHFILGKPPQGMVTDHADRNKFNNQRSNISFVTRKQNNCNVATRSKSSYRGVCRLRNSWKAGITHEGRQINLGYFEFPFQAAQAYDRAAKLYHGESAQLNFPETQNQKAA
jgi:hypothetical protein